ncbi:MAG: ABC transporter ATP-binding protein [Candidatus Methanomethylophilus sp.]|nr:ABC transporter ATP-binding protein [Methanomethylophilus sp.]MBQ4368602.1 ABC transporter ATP-binding protein [Methanomethylophilus sp.]
MSRITDAMTDLKGALRRRSRIDWEEMDKAPTEVRLENVCFEYSPQAKILHNIDLVLDEPGLYCVIGPNGVGKSTLVKCISKIQPVTSGNIYLNGRNINEMTHNDVAQMISYVPVVTQDVFSMPVLETVLIGCQNSRHFTNEESKMRAVYKSMALMQIENLSSKLFSELSAGQHQKVSIARGIVRKPKVLILDEPTANLDVKYQVYVTELLRAIAEHEKIIVLMISHDLNISAKYAHKVIMMAYPGVIYQVGTPEEVITKENVEKIYSVECKILRDEELGYPILLLGQTILDDQGRLD